MRIVTPDDVVIPEDWQIIAGADVGTYMGGVICAVPPWDEPPIFVLEEFPNYRYTGGVIELIGITVSQWLRQFGTRLAHYSGSETNHAWVDSNTQFVTEIGYGVAFERNHVHLEQRTEIAREYFQQGRIWLAPWLQVLPYELEHAHWPDRETSTGRFTRKKEKDHILDPFEHVCSRRPITSHEKGQSKARFLDQYLLEHKRQDLGPRDQHLGDL